MLRAQITWHQAGVLSNLRAIVITESYTANAILITRKNAANGNQTISYQATGTFEDTTNSDTVADGDEINFRHTPPATGTSNFTNISQIFNPTDATVTANIMSTGQEGVSLASTTFYNILSGAQSVTETTTETNVNCEQRKTGTFSFFFVQRVNNSRTTTTTHRFRKNSANGNQTVSYTTGTGIIEDTVNTDSVVAGDNANYSTVTGTGTEINTCCWGIWWKTSSSTGIAQYVTGRNAGYIIDGNDVTHYWSIQGTTGNVDRTVEADSQAKVPDTTTFSELTLNITLNTMDVGENNLFTFRKNGAATSMVVTNTPGQTGIVSDTTNTSSCVLNDLVDVEVDPNGASTDDVTVRAMSVWGTFTVAAQNITRSLSTETITIAESPAVARLKGSLRSRQETVSISENRARLAAKNRALAAQTVSVTEVSLVRIKGKVKSLATETIIVTGGTLARLAAKIRARNETVSISETPTRIAAKNRALATQTTTIGAGTIATQKGKLRALATQTVAISESLARMAAKIRTRSETVTLSDNRARLKAAMRSLATQTVAITDNASQQITEGTQQIERALATETVVISETRARIKGANRALATQTVAVTGGTLARLKASLRIIPQTIVITDARVRIKGANRSIALQTTAISENIAKRMAKIRSITQSITISEQLERTIEGANDVVRTISQTIIVSGGTLTRAMSQSRTISQSISITAPVSRIKSANRLLSDSKSISDSLLKLKGSTKNITQNTAINETLTRLLSQTRIISQTIPIADNVQRFINIVRQDIERVVSEAAINILETLQIYVVRAAERFRRIKDPSQKKVKSNHPAWLLGSRGEHDHYEEFSP